MKTVVVESVLSDGVATPVKDRVGGEELLSRRLGSGAASLSGVQILRLLGRAAVLPIVLRYFGPVQKGIVDIAMAAYGLGAIAQFQTGQAIQTFVPERLALGHRWSVRRLLWLTYGIDIISQVVLSSAMVLLAGTAARFYGIPILQPTLVALAVGNLTFVARSPINRSALLAHQAFGRATTIDILQMFGEMGAVVLVVVLKGSVVAYAWALALGPVPAFAYGWFLYFTRFRGSALRTAEEPTGREWLRSILRFGGIVSGSAALGALYQRMGTLYLGRVFDPSTVAVYGLATSIVALVWGVVSLPESLMLPALAAAAARDAKAMARGLDATWRPMFAYGTCAGMSLAAFAPEIVLLAGGRTFSPAAPLVSALGFFMLVNAPDTVRAVFYVLKCPEVTFAVFLGMVIVEFAAYFVAVGWLGVMGAVIAHIVCRGLFTIAICLLAFRATRAPDWPSLAIRPIGAMAFGIAMLTVEQWALGHIMAAASLASVAIRAALVLACAAPVVAVTIGTRESWRRRLLSA